MKLSFILITAFVCLNNVNAQEKPLDIARSNRLSNLYLKEQLKDTLNIYFNRPRNIDNMPLANVGPNGQTYLFNNGNGLDIYKSQPDNMPVAKPDSSYVDNMVANPTATKNLTDVINKLKHKRFEPKGNSKFNFVIPTCKDSLPYIDSTNKLLLKPKF